MRQISTIRNYNIFSGYPWRSPPTLYFGDIWLSMTVMWRGGEHTALFEGGFARFWSGVWMRRWQRDALSSRLGVGWLGSIAESWGITPHHLCKSVAKVSRTRLPRIKAVRMVRSLSHSWECWTPDLGVQFIPKVCGMAFSLGGLSALWKE